MYDASILRFPERGAPICHTRVGRAIRFSGTFGKMIREYGGFTTIFPPISHTVPALFERSFASTASSTVELFIIFCWTRVMVCPTNFSRSFAGDRRSYS